MEAAPISGPKSNIFCIERTNLSNVKFQQILLQIVEDILNILKMDQYSPFSKPISRHII